MNIRCKFVCTGVEDVGNEIKRVTFDARYHPETPEDERFMKWTPSGTLSVTISNPAALAALVVGKPYYLDLSPAE